MNKDIEKQIEKELHRAGGRKGNLLNNFRLNLYAGCNRYYYKQLDYMNQKFEDFWDKQTVGRGSDVWKKQTPAEFFASIDKITKEKGISFEKIESLQKIRGIHAAVELNELAFPIYVELRKIGYKNYPDLCGDPNVL